MQEIACPYSESVHDEAHGTLHTAYRHDALPNALHRSLHLIIYGKPTHDVPRQKAYCKSANGCDDVAGGRESCQQSADVGAGAVEEGVEHAELAQHGDKGYAHDQCRIDGTLHHYRAQSLGKRHSVVAAQHTATGKLAYTRHYKADGIGEEYGVDAGGRARMFAYGFEREMPSPTAKSLRQDAERE